jgi:hypothetical protein
MTRALLTICVTLGALCSLQWTTLRELKIELAAADMRAYQRALADLHDRRDEVARTITWLDEYTRTQRTFPPTNSLCSGGTLDVQAIQRLVFDEYLKARSSGASETGAREAVVAAIRGGH